MKRQCPPKFTSLGYSKRSMNGGPLAQIPERNEGKETCSETIVTIHLFMMKKTHVFDGNIWRLVEGYFAYRHRLEQIWQADCKPWVQLWKFIKPPVENDQTSRSFQLPWQIYGNCFFLFCFTKPNEANTSCIHVLVSWLVLKQFSIFLLSYRSTSLET